MSYFSLIPFPCCPSCSQRQVYTKSPVCLKALWTLIKAFSSSCCLNCSLDDWFSFKQSSSSTVSLSLTLMWSEILDVLKEKESTVHSSEFSDWRFDNLSGSHHQSQVHLTLMMTSASSALNSDDDFRLGCRNVSHHYRKQSFSGLHSPGRSNYTITCYPRVQTIYCTKSPVILSRRSAATSFLCIFVPRDSSSNVPRTKTIDSRILKFDNLIITNIRASRFHTSLQGPFAEKKKWLSHHDNFLIMSLTGVKDRIQMRKKN